MKNKMFLIGLAVLASVSPITAQEVLVPESATCKVVIDSAVASTLVSGAYMKQGSIVRAGDVVWLSGTAFIEAATNETSAEILSRMQGVAMVSGAVTNSGQSLLISGVGKTGLPLNSLSQLVIPPAGFGLTNLVKGRFIQTQSGFEVTVLFSKQQQ